jgi:hypothetical protein
MFQTNLVEKIKTHITWYMSIKLCLRKSCCLSENMETCRRVGQATEGKIAHAHCMMDNYGYKHTLGICNACCFPTATMVERSTSSLGYTRYAWCLPCVTFYEYECSFRY